MAETRTNRTSTQRSASASKSTARRKTTATKRSTTAKRGAQTRAAKRTTANAKRTTRRATTRTAAAERRVEQTTKTGVDRVAEVAEKAALTYVGTVLTARDNVVSTVDELRTKYGTSEKAQRKLETQQRKFERRGERARRSLEREVKRTRTKLERELRQRRGRFERQIDPVLKNVTSQVGLVEAQGELVGARLGNVAQTVATTGTQVAAKVSERVAALA
jgi:hypothetical protein